MQTNADPDQLSDGPIELSLDKIIEFLQESWKIIAGFTALGILGAALFLMLVPKQFEATAQIKMAQIANNNSNSPNNINPLGIYIEEPQALIARLALPTSYPKEVIEICGVADSSNGGLLLVKKIKLSIPKGVGAIIELRMRDTSIKIVRDCATAVFQLIKSSQALLIAPFIEEANQKLNFEQDRLRRATQVIAKADQSGAVVTATYLATRDEIRYLLDQISSLQAIVSNSESRSTHLTAPIFVKAEPVEKFGSLLAGLMLGVGAGLILSLANKLYRLRRGAKRGDHHGR
jgi:hypothetical protein